MSWWKQILGVCLTGYQPRCDTCGKKMQVISLTDSRGTHFRCVDHEDYIHAAQREVNKRWLDKVEALEKEIEAEDAMMFPNSARIRYGRPKIEVRRRN